MKQLKKYITAVTYSLLSAALGCYSVSAYSAVSDYAAIPPTITTSADPNVLIDLSVEWPVISAAYGDTTPSSCRATDDGEVVSLCYSETQKYLGIFDPEKCYEYDSTNEYFKPIGKTTGFSCSNAWSGNFLNWASMSSLDIIRWVLTGGNRITDTATTTVLQRAILDGHMNNGTGNFPTKRINSTDNVAPNTVLPSTVGSISVSSSDTIYVTNEGTTIKVCDKADCDDKEEVFNAQVLVCVPNISGLTTEESLEDNCTKYPGGNYKPTGLLQTNATKMRFALMSYLLHNTTSRNGGVLRAKMKYLGPQMVDTDGTLKPNPNAEWDATTGVFYTNPDPDDASATAPVAVTSSGLINYLNKFGANGYKSYDPVSEIYYECLRYYKGDSLSSNKLKATTEYYNSASSAQVDGFPVITDWNDPITHQCQNNYIIAINDAFPHRDKRLPGTYFTNDHFHALNGDVQTLDGGDWGEPSNPDPDINVTTLTNTVGILEGINHSSFNVGCSDYACNFSCTNKQITGLGQVMGTCPPSGGRQNSYYVAGLAYYANTQDIRSDLDGEQTINTFMIDVMEYDPNPPVREQNPLWLAGKYGGFIDENGDDIPQASEWDKDGDNEPDNYVRANNPENLVKGLQASFANVIERVSAGSAAAVVTNSAKGTSNLVQALYHPRYVNGTNQVTWVGRLHSIFIDKNGFLREDSNGNKKLDGDGSAAGDDKIIKILYDPTGATSVQRTRVFYCTYDGTNVVCDPDSAKELFELKTVWDAREQLANITDSDIDTNRNYSDTDGKRYIFTWLDDDDNNNLVKSSEIKPFITSTFSDPDEYSYLNLEDNNGDSTVDNVDAQRVVEYIRGKEGISGFRNRTIDFDGSGDKPWRLGDIIHSSPAVVGAPTSNWDLKYGDVTYSTFREAYKNRRQVVYVGANDGMLHAFNGGFFDSANFRFCKTDDITAGDCDTGGSGKAAAHELGSELWAYVPKNLLPHLQWLTLPDYPHVYYMDGTVNVYDVKLWGTGDSTHVAGWGTILVATMRFGGIPVTYDHDNDTSTPDITARSAIVIMDVTDPEQPPVLLAEYTDAELGFTITEPELIYSRRPDADGDWTDPSAPSKWGLVFGSGPTDFTQATSTQNAHLYILNLELDTTEQTITTAPLIEDLTNLSNIPTSDDPAAANAFTGTPLAVDWNRDFQVDAIYMGIVSGTAVAPGGKLKRILIGQSSGWSHTDLGDWDVSTLIDENKAFFTQPSSYYNTDGQLWVTAGTGRLFVKADNNSAVQETYFGAKEFIDSTTGLPDSGKTASTANLLNVTGVLVADDGSLTDSQNILDDTITSFELLVTETSKATVSGWYKNLETTPSAERNLGKALVKDGFLIFSTYFPPTDQCSSEGKSRIYALYHQTGTKYPDQGLITYLDALNSGVGETDDSEYLETGTGVMRDINDLGEDGVTGQDSTGQVIDRIKTPGKPVSGRQSWREIILE